MNRRERIVLDRLLSQRMGLAVTEKEEIWSKIKAGVKKADEPEKQHRLIRYFAWSVPTFAAAVLVIFLAIPSNEQNSHGSFSSKGGIPAKSSLAVACLSGDSDVNRPDPLSKNLKCHIGDRLVFEVVGQPKKEWFAAAAIGEGRDVVLYFPSVHRGPVKAKASILVRAAVLLGEEHSSNSYRVVGAFMDHPPTIEEWQADIIPKQGNGFSGLRLVSRLEIVR
ncbi:MAG: hypothetical protein GXP49_00640 [Deltaproteobacteria bacterium]|nr:hypothetical protein [Deltaproteobacteria bacterium]